MPIKIFLTTGLVGSLTLSVAMAQDAAKFDSATIEALKTLNTPEKRANMIRDGFHVVLSKTWPTNFPVPPYNSNVVKSAFDYSTQGQPTAVAMVITRDQPRAVFDFYQSACARANWTVRVPSAKAMAQMGKTNDDLFMLTADQGKQTMFLTCARHRATNGTMLSISWQQKL